MSPARETTTAADVGSARLSFPGIVASEWAKFFSLRSSYLVIGLFVLVTAGFNTVLCVGLRLRSDALDLATQHLSVMVAQLTAVVGTLVIGLLGALTVTNEYSSGMIYSTFATVPRRLPVLWAKAIVLMVVAAWASIVTIALSYLVGWLLLRQTPIDLSPLWGQNGRILMGIMLWVVTVAVLGLMVGALFRSTAAAVVVVVVLTFVLRLGADFVRGLLGTSPTGTYSLARRLVFYGLDALPTSAGQPLLSWTNGDAGSLLPSLHLGVWSGFAVMWGWVAVLAIPAIIRFSRRDF